MILKDKKILLGVCGSISFYKAFEILSNLKKLGADVYVMLSDGALKFVNYEAFEALSNHKVLCTKTENWQEGINHIEYSKMDLIVLAPASVNSINKLAHGFCSLFIFIVSFITIICYDFLFRKIIYKNINGNLNGFYDNWLKLHIEIG